MRLAAELLERRRVEPRESGAFFALQVGRGSVCSAQCAGGREGGSPRKHTAGGLLVPLLLLLLAACGCRVRAPLAQTACPLARAAAGASFAAQHDRVRDDLAEKLHAQFTDKERQVGNLANDRRARAPPLGQAQAQALALVGLGVPTVLTEATRPCCAAPRWTVGLALCLPCSKPLPLLPLLLLPPGWTTFSACTAAARGGAAAWT